MCQICKKMYFYIHNSIVKNYGLSFSLKQNLLYIETYKSPFAKRHTLLSAARILAATVSVRP